MRLEFEPYVGDELFETKGGGYSAGFFFIKEAPWALWEFWSWGVKLCYVWLYQSKITKHLEDYMIEC